MKVGNTYSEQQFDDGLINAINAKGGLDGERLVPVYAQTNTASTNWDSDFQAACATFTQDNHVDVVLGSDFAYEQDFEQCLTKAGVPHLSNTSNVPDRAELAQFPLLWALIVPTIEKRSIAKLQGALSSGFLSSSNRLGVVTDDCPGSQWAWANVAKPFLAQHHITVAATADEGCATGYNDSFAQAGANVGHAILAFRSAGVDRITFITSSETGPYLVMAEDASSQHYYPGWILSSLAGTAGLQGQAPTDQLASTRVYGWLPVEDVAPAQFAPPNSSQKRCLSLLKSQAIIPASAADYAYSYSICEAMFAYEAALSNDGGIPTGSAVIHGLGKLGTAMTSVFDLDGASDFSAARQDDAPRFYQQAVFGQSCGCFQYNGPLYPMP